MAGKSGKRIGGFLLILTMVLTAIQPAYVNGAERCGAESGLEKLTSTVLSDYVNLEVLAVRADGGMTVYSYADEAALEQGLTALCADDTVLFVQPNYTYSDAAFSLNDALLAQQWALLNDGSFAPEEDMTDYPVYDDPFGQITWFFNWRQSNWQAPFFYYNYGRRQTEAVAGIDINLQEALELYDGGSRETIIALIDTGVDNTHEELSDAFWVNEDEIAGNGIDDDGNGYIDDVNGWNFYSNNARLYNGSEDCHGTHCAGTIMAAADNETGIAGIVQGDSVKLMVLKALGGIDGSGSTADLVRAIQYAEENGAVICNLSLCASWNDRALYQAIANSSMLFVVAAGNDGTNSDRMPSYPAAYELDNIISVANMTYDGTLHESSDYGKSSVDLAAPGTYILSTIQDSDYGYMTGTSMAAPMVTAAAALVYSYFPELTLAQVKEILLASTAPLDALSGYVATGGMLDVGAALSYDLSLLAETETGNEEQAKPETETGNGAQAKPETETGNGEQAKPETETGNEEQAKPETDDVTAGAGSAPVIEAELLRSWFETYLLLNVADEDGDLAVLAYASGERTAADFDGGRAGTQVAPDSQGNILFTVRNGGTYTFYAADAAGNETVRVVALPERQKDSRSFFEDWFFG